MDADACEVVGLGVTYGTTVALADATFRVRRGTIMGLVGPNGAGKSTALKALVGLVPYTGTVRRASDLPVGYMPQTAEIDWDFPITVEQVVAMGRYKHLGWWRRPRAQDRAIVDNALERVGITSLRHRHIAQLSGGQRKRVFLARVLAQQPHLYLLDEPFAGVDAASEQVIVQILRELRDHGDTVVIVHHDLATVREFSDEVTLIDRTVVATGPTATTLTPANLNRAFGLGMDA